MSPDLAFAASGRSDEQRVGPAAAGGVVQDHGSCPFGFFLSADPGVQVIKGLFGHEFFPDLSQLFGI